MFIPSTQNNSLSTAITPQVWLLPDGGPQAQRYPWLARWQEVHGYARLEQHDWRRPLRGDWCARLQETLVDTPGPVVLVASGLGCILVAWWAAHSPVAAKLRGALLVAPVDLEQPELCAQLPGWSPIALQRLSFPSILVRHAQHSACTLARAQTLAQAWGSEFVALDDLDNDSVDWPAGQALLQNFLKD